MPDVYIVKYMIPRRNDLYHVYRHHDSLVFEAFADYMKRYPDVKSQAGNKKTKVCEGGISTPLPRRNPGQPSKAPTEPSTLQVKATPPNVHLLESTGLEDNT